MPTAIITGGAVRLGKALACHLADQGWNLALNHNSSDPAEVVAHAQKAGVTCKTYPGDLSNTAFAEGLIGQVLADFSDVATAHQLRRQLHPGERRAHLDKNAGRHDAR